MMTKLRHSLPETSDGLDAQLRPCWAWHLTDHLTEPGPGFRGRSASSEMRGIMLNTSSPLSFLSHSGGDQCLCGALSVHLLARMMQVWAAVPLGI